jgi:branched-chain amino acid transport system permease protein
MEYTRIFLGRFPGLDFFIAGILLIAIALLRPTGLFGLIERLVPLRTSAR